MTENQAEVIQEEVSELKPQDIDMTASAISEEDGDGVIEISNSVLVSVVRKYVLGVEGVCRFQNQSLMDGMLDILSKRSERSIVIEMPESGAEITVRVVMRFGVRIPDVAHEIQRILRERIEELTGYTVAKVNVMVTDLEEVVKKPVAVEEESEAPTTEVPEEPAVAEAEPEVPEAEK